MKRNLKKVFEGGPGWGGRAKEWKSPRGFVVVLSAGGGGGGGGGGPGCRRRDLDRRGGGGGAPCLATISSSVAGSAGGCGPVVGLPSYKKRQGGNAAWGRGGRGRGKGRGGGVALPGGGVAPANYPPGLQGVGAGLREVVNILGERNQVGTLTGIKPPPGSPDDGPEDEEEGAPRRPPRPLYRRLINYVRQAWTGVKFALDSEYEEEHTPRYRPDSLASLCRATRFTEAELKRIYRGFKAECPTGVVREETFKCIYSQFFPQGANTSQYAHYVFNTLDQDHSGILSFEDFVTGLSILSRGSIDEKLRWTFSLYDINGDGCITREEMTDIVTAVYELMGKFADPTLDNEGVRERVDRMFQKMDGNKDGVVTLTEFLEACGADPDISASMAALDTAF
ncbi:calsenilin [Orussus abietinus]|uniref:calsenilin n=1 Tax=Orussus abietinus TaxID=222816 RepID=UPI0006264FFE|nr:calsenilin [Orussus abietinus]